MYKLHEACKKMNYNEVEDLLKNGYDVNEVNEEGVTALFLSLKQNDAKLMNILIKFGANKNLLCLLKPTVKE
jgi:ankyrin repeat protein